MCSSDLQRHTGPGPGQLCQRVIQANGAQDNTGHHITGQDAGGAQSAVQQAIIDCSDYIKMVQKARKIKVFRAFAISKRADMV